MTPSLSADVFDTMHDLLHLYRASMRAEMEAIEPGLTLNELRILMFVGRHPGQTQKALVEHSHADKAQMARTLAQLEDQGWIDRHPSPEDRRVRCLALSTQGQALFARLQQSRQGVAAQLLQDCTSEVQQQLLVLLQQAGASMRDSAAKA